MGFCSSDWTRTSNHPINSPNFTQAEQCYVGIVRSVCAEGRISCTARLQVVGQLLDTPRSASRSMILARSNGRLRSHSSGSTLTEPPRCPETLIRCGILARSLGLGQPTLVNVSQPCTSTDFAAPDTLIRTGSPAFAVFQSIIEPSAASPVWVLAEQTSKRPGLAPGDR